MKLGELKIKMISNERKGRPDNKVKYVVLLPEVDHDTTRTA